MADQQAVPVGVPLGKPLQETAVQEFAADFRGEIIRRGDDGYDAARAVFNAMFDRYPALIACCTGVADVIAAVNFARENELVVAVRGGGHSVPGYGVCDGGIVIDLSPMKGIRVDPDARTVLAQAGVMWGEFDRETQVFGLAVTGGRVTHTGISGLTLGSGSGWLERKYGLTCDNLISADVVTADGRFLRASEAENEDLFWGLRGGGGNFGIVTSFKYRLHPVGPILLGGMLLYSFSRAGEILRFWRGYMETAPDELGGAAAFLTAPPAPFVPEHMKGQIVVGLIVCYAGPPEEGEEWVRPFKELGPEVDLVQPMPYTVIQTLLDPGSPPGRNNYWKAENLYGLGDEAINTIVTHAAGMTSPFTHAVIQPMGRAINRVGEDETALGGRDAAYALHALSMWENPAESDTHIAWTREFLEALEPFSTPGISLNFTSDQSEDKLKASFGSGKYERLVALKNEYDPTNLFRLNQNIKPTANGTARG
ncbi:MAG: Putative oxidoreductase [uncultured Rubrobacteraceae bacterium]|uniref:Oxidoreductase n=1 Tax=uncultured Rubrobacteraceae bacterium TaxID=349277 RepID=A0A6J4R5R4_9ACTN|nr:MAG: Putative oxidoreductase [uncultured Rubrobacteraceae bacterium]